MAQAAIFLWSFLVLSMTYLLFFKVRSELQIAPGTTYDELYASAIDEYEEENWEGTIFFMENAIREFKFHRVKLAECRRRCQDVGAKKFPEEDTLNEVRFFHTIFKKAACVRTCKSAKLGDRQYRISQEATNKFLSLMPYSYLQFAYYKEHEYYEAQCAAYTYLKAHPGDDVMRNNLQYYYNVYGAENETIVDREQRRHQKHFLAGNTAHEASNFTGVIDEFELALKYYWLAEEECRALCEGQYDSREFLDLYESIGGHYAHNLHCKEQCDDQLATMDGDVMPDYLAMHFHYLQYAYYQVGRNAEALDCAATFLLLKPDDVDMVNNVAYYEEELAVSKYGVKVRPEVQVYLDRRELEGQVLRFAETYFWEETEDSEETGGRYGSAAPINPKEVRLKDGVHVDFVDDEDDDDEDDDDDDDDEEPEWLTKKKRRGDTGSVFEKGQDDVLHEEQAKQNHTEGDSFFADIEEHESEEADYDEEYDDDDFYDYANEEELGDDDYFEPERPHITEARKRRAEEREAKLAEDDGKDSDSKFYEEFRTSSDKVKEELLMKKLAERKQKSNEPRMPKGPSEKEYSQSDLSKLYQSTLTFDTVKEMASETSRVPYPKLAGIELHKNAESLKGMSRIAVDGMASQEECDTMIRMVNQEATLGDGYKGKSQPFSEHEEFEGVTITDAVEAAANERVPLYYPATFIYLAERSRAFAQQFFSLPTHLYFSFTHLVCRQAKRDAPSERDDLSHPVHADNCIVDHERNICHKEDPAFTWRDYSAVLYLNSDFVGGNFMFANYDNTSQAEVEPKCGRLVAFSGDNLHGVRPVLDGTRCALAMWFTLDQLHQEIGMAAGWRKIEKILKEMKEKEAYKKTQTEIDKHHEEL